VWAFANGARVAYIDGVVFKKYYFHRMFLHQGGGEETAVVDVVDVAELVVGVMVLVALYIICVYTKCQYITL